jgi:HlyD family secretion protein
MTRRRGIVAAAVVLGLIVLVMLARGRGANGRYTGFVEGEERVIRSEVAGRVLETACVEGAALEAGAVLARLDDAEIAAQVEAQRREVAVLDASVRAQTERVQLTRETWQRGRAARVAEVAAAEAAAAVAASTFAREQDLVRRGASTRQQLDDTRAARDQTASALARARQLLGRTDAEERTIDVAKQELEVLQARGAQARARLKELEVTAAKFAVRAPAVATVVQTQFAWPGELAQPGTALCSVLDPRDKYVRLYVPVPDLAEFPVGRRVEVELDSRPGERIPGEVSFVADVASFTPEKIETRTDRVGQVYRAKIRILEHPERLAPGTEGDVYLVGEVPAS